MRSYNNGPNVQTICLAAVAGMRTMVAPAIVSYMLSRNSNNLLRHTRYNIVQTKGFATFFKVAAIAEIAGDKNPLAPDRIVFGGVAARGLSGALVGSAVYKQNNQKPVVGAILGATVAIAATYACFYLRKTIKERYKIADPVLGAIEDCVAIAAGLAAIS